MATLKSKRKQEAKIENLEKEVQKSSPAEETESKYLNEAEQTALSEQHESDIVDSKKVSTIKMEKAVEVVQNMFNLSDKSFVMNGFADKGGKCQLSLSNDDFDIVVVVKDNEKYGIN